MQWNPEDTRSERSQFRLQYRPAGDQRREPGLSRAARAPRAGRVLRRLAAGQALERLRPRASTACATARCSIDFAGFEYKACCWRVRAVARRSISNRDGTQEIELLRAAGTERPRQCRKCRRFPGTRNSGILAGNSRPVKNNYMIYKAFSRGLPRPRWRALAAPAAFAQTREASQLRRAARPRGRHRQRRRGAVERARRADAHHRRAPARAEARPAAAERPAPAGARSPGAAGTADAARRSRRHQGVRRDAEQRAARRRRAEQASRWPTCRMRSPPRASTTPAIAKASARSSRCRSCASAT